MKKGDVVAIGRYPVGAGGEMGPLFWRVLTVREDRLLVIARDCVDFQPFHAYAAVTWEKSDIRKLLNEVFYYEAFSEDERQGICRVPVVTGKELTFDALFLPSVREMKSFFRSDADAVCSATDYARIRGRWKPAGCCYWLRDRGYGPAYAADVLPDGSVDKDGDEVYEISGIRPMMWVTV